MPASNVLNCGAAGVPTFKIKDVGAMSKPVMLVSVKTPDCTADEPAL